VTDFDDMDGQAFVLYGIQYAPITLADAVFFLDGQFLAAVSARILGKGRYPVHDSPQVRGRDVLEVLPDGFLEVDAINGHSP